METRIDHTTGGIYRISTFTPEFRISFNQFLIDDERPAFIPANRAFTPPSGMRLRRYSTRRGSPASRCSTAATPCASSRLPTSTTGTR